MNTWNVSQTNIDYQQNYVLVDTQNYAFKAKYPPRLFFYQPKIEKKFYLHEELNGYIRYFVEETKRKSPNFNLNNFYRNINNSSIIILNAENKLDSKTIIVPAAYNFAGNVITISHKKNMHSLFHELYHLSASYIDDDGVIYSGFSQISPRGVRVGNGITEGYNALITNRNFNADFSYPVERFVMGRIEQIVGRDLMEKLYSEMNLLGLVEVLKQMGFDNEFISLLDSLDYILEASPIIVDKGVLVMNRNYDPNMVNALFNNYKSIYMDLVEISIKMIKPKYTQGLISQEQAQAEFYTLLSEQTAVIRNVVLQRLNIEMITPAFQKEIDNHFFNNMYFTRTY